jgi:hypothetical protein
MSLTSRQVLLHVAVATFGIQAQTITTGDITGVVRDPSHAVIPSATVTLKSTERGDQRTAQTGDQGSFHFNFLKPGIYTLGAVTTGLESDTAEVTVSVGQAIAIDLIAKVRAVKEAIEIKAETQIVATENANSTTTFNAQQIEGLPMPGGDITTLAFTVPGIVMSTGAGTGNFSSHGLPSNSNLFTLNGTDYNEPWYNVNITGASNLTLGQTEIQEASVVQNGFSVQYGRQAGANVNYITKSGTNGIHGDLLYNFNNHLMNANDFFSNATSIARPYSVSQQWGADIGGPAIKNKLFWYVDSEGLYYTLPTSGVVNIPSPALQTYILGNLQPVQRPLYQNAFNLWNSAPGASRAVPVTNGNGPFQDSQGLMGCGELAANNVVTPGGGIFGQNVSCLNAWGSSGANTTREWFNSDRVDWNINASQRIFFRFKGDHGFQPSSTNLISPVFNTQSIQPRYEGQINHTYVNSGTMVNNFIFSIFWYSSIFGPADIGKSSAAFPTFFGIGGDAGSNNGGIYSMGVPWFSYPFGRRMGQGQLSDDLSVIKGRHSLKFGFNFRRNRYTNYGYQEGRIGSYFFSTIVDFANGVTNPDDGSLYYQVFSPLQDAHNRMYNLGVYAMDEWAIRPNLKLTLGVRFDRTPNFTCLDKCFSHLTDQFSLPSFQKGVDIPYNSSIQSGLSQPYYSVDPVVADPRLAVAWTPGKASGLVVRSGFGLFSDLAPGILAFDVFTNAPYPYTAVILQGQEVGQASDPNSAAAAALTQFNAFKSGFFSGQTLGQLQSSVPGGFSPPPYFSIPHHYSTAQYAEWSFEIEQRVGTKSAFTATYSGNYGYNLLVQNGFVNAFANTQQFPNGFGGLPLTAPDPRFGAILELTNSGISRYNGLSLQFRRALGWGFQGQISYTWSHALDDISNGGSGLGFSYSSLGNPGGPSVRDSYSNADYDVRHNMVADFLWNTPWTLRNHLLDETLNNWTVGGKIFLRSGSPFSIIDSELAGTLSPNINAVMLAGYQGSMPIARQCGANAVNMPCYSLSDFVPSLQETTYGNVARNSFYGPGYFDIDATLFKNFPIAERMKFSVGAQAYNLMNHPHFANPNFDVAGTGFGTITSTLSQPTSPYGSFAGSAVAGRVLVLTGRFTF